MLLQRCHEAECSRCLRICNTCLQTHGDSTPRRRSCWCGAGAQCIACGKTAAQTEHTYKSRCKACLVGPDAAAACEFLRDESLVWEKRQEARRQIFTGAEAAFQLLTLPVASDSPLPAYAARPGYLSPVHCRLCLQPCSSPCAEGTAVGAEVEAGAAELEPVSSNAAVWGVPEAVAKAPRGDVSGARLFTEV